MKAHWDGDADHILEGKIDRAYVVLMASRELGILEATIFLATCRGKSSPPCDRSSVRDQPNHCVQSVGWTELQTRACFVHPTPICPTLVQPFVSKGWTGFTDNTTPLPLE